METNDNPPNNLRVALTSTVVAATKIRSPMEREGETPRILLIVEYYIYHIIINTHVDDDVMAQNMTCLVGYTAPRRSSILGAGSWCQFWFDHFFCRMIFGQVMAKMEEAGAVRKPFGHFRRMFGWCVWWDKRVKSYTNSYKFAKTKKTGPVLIVTTQHFILNWNKMIPHTWEFSTSIKITGKRNQ